MDELPLRLKSFLADAAEQLREVHLPTALAEALERLSGQVDQPCVVAVVGRMKSGKSTFINALLAEDLAKVGVTETTATINLFRYGQTNPARPVRCYWQNGTVTEHDREFLDGLQGTDVEMLRRASGIKHLEYHLLNPYLKHVVLVDTPGTSAVVDEHVQRTAEFLALREQLRDRHDSETRRLGSEADAVIYLVGAVTCATDKALLEGFAEATGGRSRALNAVGVLAKVDLHPDILRRRHELAAKIGVQLKESLNTVVPISAGIQREVQRLREKGDSGIPDFLATLGLIPTRRLEKFLDSDEFYRTLEPDDCPVTVAQREQLLGKMPWAVFTALVRAAVSEKFEPSATESAWRSLAGFDQVHVLLERHFIRRAQFLRCHRIAGDARKLLNEVRFKILPEQRWRDREQTSRFDRFLGFLRGARDDPTVAKELEDFLVQQAHLQSTGERIESVRKGLDRRLAEFVHTLEDSNADFAALQILEDHVASFSLAELEELRCLFGLYGLEFAARGVGDMDIGQITSRQQHWLTIAARDSRSERRSIAERAVACYGSALHWRHTGTVIS